VVVYLDGIEYGNGLDPQADAALAEFVANGGGLIRTEWSVWAGTVNPQTDPLTPLTYAGQYKYGTGWQVLLPDHPLAKDVPDLWWATNGYSYGDPVPGATVVIESDAGWPLMTYRSDTGGTVVHINHDLLFKADVLEPNLLQLFVNAVEFASTPVAP
jgi:hypothetical protein